MKSQNRIYPLLKKDITDNNLRILFSIFNILKSNKMEEKELKSDFQNKNENDSKNKDSMFSIYFFNSQNENEEKKKKIKEQNEEKIA